VVVTGGLGFIGSNLAVNLVQQGAHVTVIDSQVPGCGSNPHNVAIVCADLHVIREDIANAESLGDKLRSAEVIFNLAGEISHIHSMQHPWRDADLNAAAQLKFVDACARHAPGVRMVYASTRQIYGVPQYLPVDEQHPVRPVDFNGIHKYAAHQYHLLYSAMGKVDAAVLCLTNVYGPRMALNIPCQGFLSHFLRRSLFGQPIEIFGDGRQLRDPVYVDDVVNAFLLAGALPRLSERVWNVGGPEPLPLSEIAEMMSTAAGAPHPVFRPFPAEMKRIDIGSFASSWSRLNEATGWRPSVLFADGIQRSLDFYRREFPRYLAPKDVHPVCPLELEMVDGAAAGSARSATPA
jgi:UDP-glucose 4-epimerase